MLAPIIRRARAVDPRRVESGLGAAYDSAADVPRLTSEIRRLRRVIAGALVTAEHHTLATPPEVLAILTEGLE